MYNENKNLLFIHIPKTGGLSILEYMKRLQNNINPASHKGFLAYLNHVPLKYYYNDILGKEKIKATVKFTSVRNPVSRLKSIYFFIKVNELSSGAFNLEHLTIKNFLPIFYEKINSDEVTVEKYWKRTLTSGRFDSSRVLFLRQFDFVNPEYHNDVTILKLENLNEDFRQFILKHNFEKINLPHINKATPKGYTSKHFWLEATKGQPKEIINGVLEFYKEDFRLFNYDMDEWLK